MEEFLAVPAHQVPAMHPVAGIFVDIQSDGTAQSGNRTYIRTGASPGENKCRFESYRVSSTGVFPQQRQPLSRLEQEEKQMSTSEFFVVWCIRNEGRNEFGSKIIEVPDSVYDEDADRDREMDDDLSPLVVYLAEELHEVVGVRAEVHSYWPVD